MDDSLIGSIIDGKYQILSLIGKGGTGSVYKARQCDLSRFVAIKIMHSAANFNAENRIRFERESRILAGLKHPNIVSIYTFSLQEDYGHCMIMEYLEGKTLSEILHDKKGLEENRVINVGIQICKALDYAHKSQIVHRDLKPQNIMLLDSPAADSVKILDFGLSKVIFETAEESRLKLTRTGTLIGSVFYVSPEACTGRSVDERSDIYSLGCLLYELLSGRPPFSDQNPINIMHKHEHEFPQPLSQIPGLELISPELELLIFRCMQKDPRDRYQSAAQAQSDLEMIRNGRANELTLSNIQLSSREPAQNKSQFSFILLAAALSLGLVFLLNSKLLITQPSTQDAKKYIKRQALNSKQVEWQAQGTPERRLLSLCHQEKNKEPASKSIEELNILIPQLHQPELLYLAFREKGQLCMQIAGTKKGAAANSDNREALKSFRQALSFCKTSSQKQTVESLQLLAAIAEISTLALDYQKEGETAANELLQLSKCFQALEEIPSLSRRSPGPDPIVVDPEESAYFVLGQIAYKRGEFSLTRCYCEKAFKVCDLRTRLHARIHLLFADALDQEGHIDKAMATVKQYSSLVEANIANPDCPRLVLIEALGEIGSWYARQNLEVKALSSYKEALKLAEENELQNYDESKLVRSRLQSLKNNN